MTNVVRLFGRMQIEKQADPANVTIAQTNVLAMCAELEGAIEELLNRFVVIDDVIDLLGDPEARKRQDQLREALTIAALKLSQAIKRRSLKVTAVPKQETGSHS